MKINQRIRKNFSKTAALLLFMLSVSAVAAPSAQSMAASHSFTAAPTTSSAALATSICSDPNHPHCDLPKVNASPGTVSNIIKVVFGIIGAFALLSMTASGLKYITSGGDPQKTSEAKKGIIFALVGLMIAVSAEAIVAFVVNRGAP